MGLGDNWGATAAERADVYGCDGLLEGRTRALFRAIDVEAPAPVAFRWLCQLRVAPYSYDWLDNWGRRSPRRLTPGLEDLAVGQTVCRIFRLESFVPDRELTLVMVQGRRAFGDVAVTYRVVPQGERGSRYVVKLLVREPGRSVLARARSAVLPVADLVMMRKQLRTLAGLAASR